MKKEYVKELKLLMQMISEGASNDVVRDQAKKVFDMGERIISELEDAGNLANNPNGNNFKEM